MQRGYINFWSVLLIDSPEEEIILSVLKSRKYLRVLEVSNCSFRASLELGSMIQKSIQSLNLINNTYTHSDFMLLCDSIGSCKLLKSLNLGGTWGENVGHGCIWNFLPDYGSRFYKYGKLGFCMWLKKLKSVWIWKS